MKVLIWSVAAEETLANVEDVVTCLDPGFAGLEVFAAWVTDTNQRRLDGWRPLG